MYVKDLRALDTETRQRVVNATWVSIGEAVSTINRLGGDVESVAVCPIDVDI